MRPTNSSQPDSCSLHLPPISRVVLSTVLVLLASLGAVGNSILGFYVVRNTELRSLINILLATMAVSDALTSLLCTPFDVATIITSSWMFDENLCFFHSFTLSALVVLNVIVLVVISVDRYYILVHKKDRLRGCHNALLIAGCALLSAAASSPPLFGSGRLIFANEYCRQIYTSTNEDYVYSLLYSSVLFVLPCGLLLLAYVHIIIVTRNAKRRIQPRADHRISMGRIAPKINVKFKQRTFSTILCLYAAAVVCKLPLAVTVFVQSHTVCPVAHWIRLLTYLNAAANPCIYALKISEYWTMLTGRFHDVQDQVRSFKSSRKRSQVQNIYMVTTESTTSVI